MARSANRLRSLQRAFDLVHDRAFNPQKYPIPPSAAAHSAVAVASAPAKSRKECLEERFRQSVQKEFARLGIA